MATAPHEMASGGGALALLQERGWLPNSQQPDIRQLRGGRGLSQAETYHFDSSTVGGIIRVVSTASHQKPARVQRAMLGGPLGKPITRSLYGVPAGMHREWYAAV
jgi:hypothetical protein